MYGQPTPKKSSNSRGSRTYAPPNMLSAKKEREYEVVRPANRKNNNRKATSSTTSPDRPPAKVFFPSNNKKTQNDPSGQRSSDISHLQSEDSVTTDSYLDQSARNGKKSSSSRQYQSRGGGAVTSVSEATEGNSSSVYHLAHHQDIRPPSPKHRKNLNEWYDEQRSRDPPSGVQSEDTEEDAYTRTEEERQFDRRRSGGFWGSMFGNSGTLSYGSDTIEDGQAAGVFRVTSSTDGLGTVASYMQETVFGDEDYLKTKQETAYLAIGLTSIQLLILCMQLAMCGIASFDVNPFIGTYPSEISEWGGKNAYLMIQKNQWFRLVTPSLLHVGVLHLLANAFCQLEPIALFEREWGSTRWFVIYFVSSVASSGFSSLVEPDSIAVGSSGALMGMFSAKFAQVLSHLLFEVNKANQDDMVRFDQLSSVVCGLILVSILSCFTYIEWSGHMGGLATGFFSGMLLFCNPIRSCCVKFFWALIGLCGVVGFLTYVFYSIFVVAEPASEELADACEYFRAFFPEDYECGCSLW